MAWTNFMNMNQEELNKAKERYSRNKTIKEGYTKEEILEKYGDNLTEKEKLKIENMSENNNTISKGSWTTYAELQERSKAESERINNIFSKNDKYTKSDRGYYEVKKDSFHPTDNKKQDDYMIRTGREGYDKIKNALEDEYKKTMDKVHEQLRQLNNYQSGADSIFGGNNSNVVNPVQDPLPQSDYDIWYGAATTSNNNPPPPPLSQLSGLSSSDGVILDTNDSYTFRWSSPESYIVKDIPTPEPIEYQEYNGVYWKLKVDECVWEISESPEGKGYLWLFDAKSYSLNECCDTIKNDNGK